MEQSGFLLQINWDSLEIWITTQGFLEILLRQITRIFRDKKLIRILLKISSRVKAFKNLKCNLINEKKTDTIVS